VRYNKPFYLVYVEGLSNENSLNLGYINHSLLQLGHTGNRRFDHVVYLVLYEYEGIVHLINHTQVESKIRIHLKLEVYGEEIGIDEANFWFSSSANICCKN